MPGRATTTVSYTHLDVYKRQALFGVGSMSARLPSHVYSGGFLDPSEIAAAQNDGVVGDVCTVLIREDGSTNMHLNERASGPSPATLKTVSYTHLRVTDRSGPAPVCYEEHSPIVISGVGARETYTRLLPTTGPVGTLTARVREHVARLGHGGSAVTVYLTLDHYPAGVDGSNVWVNTCLLYTSRCV